MGRLRRESGSVCVPSSGIDGCGKRMLNRCAKGLNTYQRPSNDI